MKQFKLMLVAFFAMVSTAVFAQDYATTTFRYHLEDGEGTTKVAVIDGFVADYATASMATVTIPAQVTNPTDATKKYNVIGIAGDAFNKNANIKKVVIESTTLTTLSEAFAGCANLAEVDFTKATGLTEIAWSAFAGTKIQALDLSTTKLDVVVNMFGSHVKRPVTYTEAEAIAYNAKLEGAVKAGDIDEEHTYTAETAAAYNATLDGAVEEGDPKVGEGSEYTAETAAAYNATLEDALALTIGVAFGDAAVAYNTLIGVENAVDGEDVVTAAQKAVADNYNATLDGAVKAGDPIGYTAEEAAAYNAGLEGAVAEGQNMFFTELTAAAYNTTIEGAVEANNDAYTHPEDAVAYASLTTVKLPNTWTKIWAGSFENCTGLATIDFGTIAAADLAAHAAQEIEGAAFLGTALTALNFTGTKVSGILPENLLIDGTEVKKNESLETVTLIEGITGLAGNFANCTKLKAIDLTNIAYANFGEGEFEGCAALTAITIPASYTGIPASAFKDCTALAKVTFTPAADGEAYEFNSIGGNAFANTALTSFTVPSALPYNAPNGVAENAFADCVKLTSFTYKPTIGAGAVAKVVNDKAFLGCNDGITFYTVKGYAEAQKVDDVIIAPTHTTFSYDADPDAGEEEEAKVITAKIFKNGNNKYFAKYENKKENIKIAKTDAKVYAAYNADDDKTIVMQQFKTNGGYYHIAAGDRVLIISDIEKIPYETSTLEGKISAFAEDGADFTPATAGQGTSWLINAGKTPLGEGENAADQNKLQYISAEGGVKRSVLEGDLPAGYSIFAWSNTTSGTGWLKITSGSTFPQNTMYIFAKPTQTAEGARVNVIWLDENGFVEDETTAIQGISTKSENEDGAIYNVAGQKVNASYKGLVIKDGKKYMKK